MKVPVLILGTVYVVQADIFVRLYNSTLDQVFLEKQTRSDLACSRLCLGMSECNAFNFTSTEQRCKLARNITEVANIDENVYTRKPFQQPFVSIKINITINDNICVEILDVCFNF